MMPRKRVFLPQTATQLRHCRVLPYCCRLKARGHSSYIAGGWVRDRFLGRPAVDIDIASSAGYPEVSSVNPKS